MFVQLSFCNSETEIQKNLLASQATMMAGNKFESVSHNLLHVQQCILFKLGVEITLDKVHFPFFL